MSEKIALQYGREEGDFFIEHAKRTEPYSRTSHHHGGYEIYYLLAGRRAYFIKDRTYLICPGDLVFINKQEVHKTTDAGPPGHERIVINFTKQFIGGQLPYFDPALLKPFDLPSRVFRLNLQEQHFVYGLLSKLSHEIVHKAAGYETYIRLLLAELLLFASRRCERKELLVPEHTSKVHRKISDIVKYINANFRESLGLHEIAERFDLSPFYLSRSFKEVTGFSFVEYINTARMKEAQRLLKRTDLKIIEIAGAVGFENIAHFGRTFKKYVQYTPAQYRKLHKEVAGR